MTWEWTIVTLVALAALAGALLYLGRSYWAWVGPVALGLGAWGFFARPPLAPLLAAVIPFLLLAVLFGFRPLRRRVISRPLMPLMRRMLPSLGDTERVALESGGVWWEEELFSGRPDWRRLLEPERSELSEREREFLDGPVEELCRQIDDWQIRQRGDLPAETWEFIKQQRFWGMIIPEKYGGLGFSHAAHAAVVTRLATRSVAAAVTVMVPNSLGPAELLLKYGTDEQKERLLPRLARGEEIPCFGLTEPEAGSDAANTQSVGIVTRGEWQGEEVLGMRLSWEKRYITLGPVATLLGLSFRLRDPDRLLGDREDLGITCALIPTDLPGVEIGERHDPLGVPFQNGPNAGEDVFVPLDFVIGGRERAGEGWRMLMESLAAGRSVSMPSLAVGAAQLSTRVVSAHGVVRRQFGVPIGVFEGVEEPIARIAGTTYLMDAARHVTIDALERGEDPAVLSAVVKWRLTESMRDVVNDAMDVRAGAGIVRGPRNILSEAHQAVPIGITVEGANILQRSMIVFGQGAIRCHPCLLDEIHSLENDDAKTFDRAFFRHVGRPFELASRCLIGGLSRGLLAAAPDVGALSPEMRRLARLTAAFALVSEVALVTIGGALKRKERISGRLADALAWLYLGQSVIAEYRHRGAREEELPLARWGARHAVDRVKDALVGVLDNLPNRVAGLLVRWIVFPWGTRRPSTDDSLGHAVARAVLDQDRVRDALTRDVFVPPAEEPGLGVLEHALRLTRETEEIEKRVREAVDAGKVEKEPEEGRLERAVEAGVISAEARDRLREAAAARRAAIEVDAFPPQAFPAMSPRDTTEVGLEAQPV